MTWADFYLICFVVGFAFSVLSFLMGGHHWHLPFHFHLHGGGPVVHTGTHAPTGQASGHGPHHTAISVLNPVTLAAFLAWFGGMGYLLTRYSGMAFVASLALAVFAGLVAAAIVFLFVARVLTSEEQHLDPADFDMVGVLGRLSVPIRQGGTGELIYSQAGTRRVCGARTENGSAVSKGTEVVVKRYEKGIAYVQLWSELAGEDEVQGASENSGGVQ